MLSMAPRAMSLSLPLRAARASRPRSRSDVFILAGAEDLVPVLDATSARKWLPRTVYGTSYRVFLYRPRIEGSFTRIERWVANGTGLSHWRTISRDNITTLYGYDDLSCIADPDDASRIFCWNI